MRSSWIGVPPVGAASYNVYRTTTSGSGYELQNNTPITNNYYDDTNVQYGVTYYYEVSAVDDDGNESARSSELAANPYLAPPVVSGNADDQQVELSWTPIPGAVTYNVLRYDGVDFNQINTSPITGTNFTDTGLTNSTTYSYEVAAVDADGNQSNSAAISEIPGSLRHRRGGLQAISKWN